MGFIMEFKVFKPKWLKEASRRLFGDEEMLAIAERETITGKRTFALFIDTCGRSFPEFIMSDVPLGMIREFVDDLIHGAELEKIDVIFDKKTIINHVKSIPGFNAELIRIAELGRKDREGETGRSWV